MQPSGRLLLAQSALLCILWAYPADGSKKSTTRNGRHISRYVPNYLLPPGKVVDVIEAQYRVVGPGAQLKFAQADPKGFTSPFERLFARANYVTRVSFRENLSAPLKSTYSGTELAACSDTRSDTDAFANFQGLDVIIIVGVTRETFQVETGGVEWAYALLLSSLLQHNGFDVKPILQYCNPVPDGVGTIKYIPQTALYGEQTVLKLTSEEDSPLLPFTANKQNLVLKVIDSLGLHQKSGTARINITAVSQECRFVGGRGHLSTVNITLVTQRSDPYILFSMALRDMLPGLLEGLVEEGLAVASAQVVSSQQADHLGLHGKIAALLEPDDPVRIYDERLPADQLPQFSLEGSGIWDLIWKHKGALAAVIASLAALAGATWYTLLRAQDYPDTCSESKASSVSAASDLQPLPPTLTSHNALLTKMASHSSLKPRSSFFSFPSRATAASGLGTPFQVPPAADNLLADLAARQPEGPDMAARQPDGPDVNVFEDSREAPFQQGPAVGPDWVGVADGRPGSEWAAPCLLVDTRSESSTSSVRIAADFRGAAEFRGAHDIRAAADFGAAPLSDGDKPWTDPPRNRTVERLEEIKGWQIQEGEVQICKRPDGSDYLLGEGGYGKVYKGMRDRVQEVAVKVLHDGDAVQMQEFEFEIKLLQSLSFDRNVVQFLGASLKNGRPMLVLEFMEGGDLHDAVQAKQERFLWRNQGQHLALDVVRGLHFLHKNKVLHGDLKSRNVLLGRNAAYAKLSDVGLSRMLTSNMNSGSLSPDAVGGTFASAAPEMLLGLKCTSKADIFSLGILMYEIITQETPARGQMRDIRVPEECPQAVAELVDQCLDSDPRNRPTCQEVYDVISSNLT